MKSFLFPFPYLPSRHSNRLQVWETPRDSHLPAEKPVLTLLNRLLALVEKLEMLKNFPRPFPCLASPH